MAGLPASLPVPGRRRPCDRRLERSGNSRPGGWKRPPETRRRRPSVWLRCSLPAAAGFSSGFPRQRTRSAPPTWSARRRRLSAPGSFSPLPRGTRSPRHPDVAAPDPPRRPCPIRWLGARSRHGRRTPSMRRRPTAGPAAGRPMAPPVHAPGPRAGAAAETAAQGSTLTPLPSGAHRQRHAPPAVLGK